MKATSRTTNDERHVQADLFESRASFVSVDKDFRTARRTAIDDRSWVEVVPGWMSGSRALSDRLREVVPFCQHDRRLFDQTFQEPRLTASYRDLSTVPEPVLLEAAEALSLHFGVAYDSIWLNLYRDGDDSTGWHRDRHLHAHSTVPVLTLGATRRFLLKPRTGGKSLAFRPGSGDLIVMGGRCQEDWVHSVPKDPGVTQTRISINFQSSAQHVTTHPAL